MQSIDFSWLKADFIVTEKSCFSHRKSVKVKYSQLTLCWHLLTLAWLLHQSIKVKIKVNYSQWLSTDFLWLLFDFKSQILVIDYRLTFFDFSLTFQVKEKSNRNLNRVKLIFFPQNIYLFKKKHMPQTGCAVRLRILKKARLLCTMQPWHCI